MNYSLTNKDTYETLADEYERRVKSLIPITGDAMDYFASYLKPSGKVLDTGCGVGIAINILNKKGFNVTGIEISPRMAEYAKKRNPDSKIIVGDFLETSFNEKFDGILSFAFIHLFPKNEVGVVFEKTNSVLNVGGVVLISSTESEDSKEGWYIKKDFSKKEKRFRKFWTETELENKVSKYGFKKVALKKFTDPYGKKWMDFIFKKVQFL